MREPSFVQVQVAHGGHEGGKMGVDAGLWMVHAMW
jgi:hypothetical protein